MSDKVTEIGADAFARCSNLKSVTVGNLYCLEYFSNLGVLDITFGGRNASRDGRCLFSGGTLERFVSTGLTSYDFPAGLTNIGTEALNECKNLQSVTVGSYQAYDAFSKAGIPVSAFTGSNASSDGRCLIINGKLTIFIGDGATEYAIPQNVTKISEGVFNNCSSLANITIPTGVTAIGNNQFPGCNDLAAITCLAMTPPAISDLGIAEATVIYVPKDAIKEYKKDPNWEIYKKQIKAIK